MTRTVQAALLLAMVLPGAAGAQAAPAGPAAAPCPVQPMPSPLDSLDRERPFGKAIAFAAVPSLEHPGSAWAIRVSRRGPDEGALEILLLRRNGTCNIYDLVQRWDAALDAHAYARIVTEVEPFLIPPSDTFSHGDAMRGLDEIGTDGTSLELRGYGDRFEVRRGLHNSGKQGTAVSALFRRLIEAYVPADRLPTGDWRLRRR